jgi:hypothetical protein
MLLKKKARSMRLGRVPALSVRLLSSKTPVLKKKKKKVRIKVK